MPRGRLRDRAAWWQRQSGDDGAGGEERNYVKRADLWVAARDAGSRQQTGGRGEGDVALISVQADLQHAIKPGDLLEIAGLVWEVEATETRWAQTAMVRYLCRQSDPGAALLAGNK